jgi:hypothetical protein
MSLELSLGKYSYCTYCTVHRVDRYTLMLILSTSATNQRGPIIREKRKQLHLTFIWCHLYLSPRQLKTASVMRPYQNPLHPVQQSNTHLHSLIFLLETFHFPQKSTMPREKYKYNYSTLILRELNSTQGDFFGLIVRTLFNTASSAAFQVPCVRGC